MAKANSSASRKPSASTSDSFHILLSTELGNFDLMSSDLAPTYSKTVINYTIFYILGKCSYCLTHLLHWSFHQLDSTNRKYDLYAHGHDCKSSRVRHIRHRCLRLSCTRMERQCRRQHPRKPHLQHGKKKEKKTISWLLLYLSVQCVVHTVWIAQLLTIMNKCG